MNRFLKLLLGVVAAGFLLITSGAALADSQKGKPVSLLFTLQLNPVSFKHLQGDHYQLKIPVTSVKKILAFTDRPQRKSFLLTPQAYTKITGKPGKRSFKKYPPNITVTLVKSGFMGVFAVLSSERTKSMDTLTLQYLPAITLPTNTNSTKKIDPKKLTLAAGPPKSYQDAAYLFVDGVVAPGSRGSACWRSAFGNYSNVHQGIVSWFLDVLGAVGIGEWVVYDLCGSP